MPITLNDGFIPTAALFSWEFWMSIVGFEGYDASNFGQIRSHWRGLKPLILSPATNKAGYRYVTIRRQEHVHVSLLVHRIVLCTFSPQPCEHVECRHLDGIKANNRLSNLRWGTRSENMRDRVTHGCSNQGSRHGMSKLTEDQVREIIRLSDQGEKGFEIAKTFGVHQSTISQIVNRIRWKHI